MKKTDWALVVLIVAIVGLGSYFTIGALLPNPVDNPETVPTATLINSQVNRPNEDIFNENAINPAVETSADDQLSPFFQTSPVATDDDDEIDLDNPEEN